MNRRGFFLLLPFAGAALRLHATPPTTASGPVLSPMQHRLVELFSETKSAYTIGKRYLRTHPHEADSARLLFGDSAGSLRPCMDTAHLRRSLGAMIAADFEAGHTVLVDGWLLSRTETRLCALAALASRAEIP